MTMELKQFWWNKTESGVFCKMPLNHVADNRTKVSYVECDITAVKADDTKSLAWRVELIVPDLRIALPDIQRPWEISYKAVIPKPVDGWELAVSGRVYHRRFGSVKEAIVSCEEMIARFRMVNKSEVDALIARHKAEHAFVNQWQNELDSFLDGRGYVWFEPVVEGPVYYCGTDECYGPKDERDGPVHHKPTCVSTEGVYECGDDFCYDHEDVDGEIVHHALCETGG